MALFILALMYLTIVIVTITLQVLLYKKNLNKTIFILNVLFSLSLSALAFTSFPLNFTIHRSLAVAFGVLTMFSIFVKLKSTHLLASKWILTIAILGNLILLFI